MRLPLVLLLVVVLVGLGWLALGSGVRERRVVGAPCEDPVLGPPEHGPSLEPATVADPGPAAALPGAGRAPGEASVDPATLAPTSRGRLVDASTLEPIPDAMVATSRKNDWTRADGWFDTGDVLDELPELMVVNVSRGTATHEIPRERWTRLARGWQIPLAIGPTYRLKVRGVEGGNWETWEGRLVQEERPGSHWLGLRSSRSRADALPFLRFEQVPDGLDPEAKTWVELRSQDGRFEGRAEVHALRGVQVVEVEGRARAAVQGRVVDAEKRPLRGVSIEAVLISDTGVERVRATSAPDGTYQLCADEPGHMQLLFLPIDPSRRESRTIEVPRGLTRVPDVVLAVEAPVGAIAGRLNSGGPRRLDGVQLRALDGSFEVWTRPVRASMAPVMRSISRSKTNVSSAGGGGAVDGADTISFLFQDVPSGRYEISVVSSDGQRWSPASQVVEAPAQGLLFEAVDSPVPIAYHLDVRDAETGRPIENPRGFVDSTDVTLRMQVSLRFAWDLLPGKPLLELVQPTSFQWTAMAPGYRAARGSELDFQNDGSKRTASVALRRGYSACLRFLDWSRSTTGSSWLNGPSTRRIALGPAGVQVLADGAWVATSDEHGLAWLDLEAEPERIELRHAGWRVVEARELVPGKLASAPETEIWLVRE